MALFERALQLIPVVDLVLVGLAEPINESLALLLLQIFILLHFLLDLVELVIPISDLNGMEGGPHGLVEVERRIVF